MRLWTCRATLTAVVVADMPLDAVEQMRALVSAGDTGLDCSVSVHEITSSADVPRGWLGVTPFGEGAAPGATVAELLATTTDEGPV